MYSASTVHGSGSYHTLQSYDVGYAVVSPEKLRGKKKLCERDHLITVVHIDGHPFLWVIQWLQEHLPNLQKIQVTPKREADLGSEHRRLCAERKIQILFGHHNPGLAWDNEMRSPHYKRQREFLRTLSGEQAALFTELQQLGFHEAHLTARYFCLNDEEFMAQWQVARELDLPGFDRTYLSECINAVLCYLDPTFKAGKSAHNRAEGLRRRVSRLRTMLADAITQQEIINSIQVISKRLGLAKLPDGLPLSRLDVFEAVIEASRQPTYSHFTTQHPREHAVLVHRFGLQDGMYRTLIAVGALLDGITRERVRQLEEKAFTILGIVEA